MNKQYLPIFALIFMSAALFAQAPIYVNSAATGANNGSSWADAYTDFQSAIDDTSSPNVWVAAGTYTPGADGYMVGRQMNIYGSFAGNETSVEDRDIAGNPTTFNGDVNGDDWTWNPDIWSQSTNLQDGFSRDSFILATLPIGDNLQHIMVVDSSAAEVLLDGVTFKGGNAREFDDSLDEFEYRGAGIFSLARLKVANCRFTENIAGSGAGVFIRDLDASGSIFQNCVFDNNGAYGQGALFMLFTTNIEVSDCKFNNNSCARGALYPNRCVTVTVKNCEFEDNINEGGFGGAFFNWHSDNVDLVDCQFRRNVAGNGGCIYSDHRDYDINQQSEDNFLIQNCTFEDNEATSWGGGAIRVSNSSFQALNCTFNRNRAVSTGGAIAANGDVKKVRINGSTFEFNQAAGGWGGATAIYGDTTFAVVQNSIFENNSAVTSGGAATNGFGAQVTYENCTFESNNARFGGAMFTQNDESNITIKGSDFLSNIGESAGGGVNSSSGSLTVENSKFEGNQAETGGGITISEDSLDFSILNLSNTIFNFNLADVQGGGLNIGNANSNITSCVFSNNVANDLGTGGAISMNASGDYGLNVNMMNSTLINNSGDLAGGIATWTDFVVTSNLFLQNNAFISGIFDNYGVEDGITQITSTGGNFSSDGTLSLFLNNGMDLDNNQANPMFVDGFIDFHILEGSVFIDAGVATNAPTTDLDGTPRLGNVDIGAYEFNNTVSTNDYFELENGLSLSPNPAGESTVLTVDNHWVGDFEYYLYDRTGKILEKSILNKVGNVQEYPISVKFLMQGDYYIVLKKGNATSVERMLKQ